MDAEISLKHQELELYLRQCHGERDLEALGREVPLIRSLKLVWNRLGFDGVDSEWARLIKKM